MHSKMCVEFSDAPSLEVPKARLDEALGSLIWWGNQPMAASCGARWPLRYLWTQAILWFCDSMWFDTINSCDCMPGHRVDRVNDLAGIPLSATPDILIWSTFCVRLITDPSFSVWMAKTRSPSSHLCTFSPKHYTGPESCKKMVRPLLGGGPCPASLPAITHSCALPQGSEGDR